MGGNQIIVSMTSIVSISFNCVLFLIGRWAVIVGDPRANPPSIHGIASRNDRQTCAGAN